MVATHGRAAAEAAAEATAEAAAAAAAEAAAGASRRQTWPWLICCSAPHTPTMRAAHTQQRAQDTHTHKNAPSHRPTHTTHLPRRRVCLLQQKKETGVSLAAAAAVTAAAETAAAARSSTVAAPADNVIQFRLQPPPRRLGFHELARRLRLRKEEQCAWGVLVNRCTF